MKICQFLYKTVLLCLLIAQCTPKNNPLLSGVALAKMKDCEAKTPEKLVAPADSVYRLTVTANLTSAIGGFPRIQNLRWLNYYGKPQTAMPAEVGKLANLQHLYIESGITTLPPEIGNWEHLEYLHLMSPRLTSLPAEIGKLSKLRKIELIKTSLSSLPDAFYGLQPDTLMLLTHQIKTSQVIARLGDMKSLKALYLSFDHPLDWEQVFKGLGKAPQLKELRLRNMGWKTLPESFAQMQQIERLHLAVPPQLNPEQMVEVLAQLKNLKALRLVDYQLAYLPKNLGKLKQLTELDLTKSKKINPEQSIELIAQLSNLKKLILNRCISFENFPSNFLKLKHLEYLGMGGTRMKNIPTGIEQFKKLKYWNITFTDLARDKEKMKKLQQLLPNTTLYNNGMIYSIKSGKFEWIKKY
jgi:Leucine-rich repeat (LRR) protein